MISHEFPTFSAFPTHRNGPPADLQLIRQLLGKALLHRAEELRGLALHLADGLDWLNQWYMDWL